MTVQAVSRRFLLMGMTVVVAGKGVWAGSLDPSGAPGPTMHSLEDIYQKVAEIAVPQSLAPTTTVVKAGYYLATDLTSVDADLASDNIRAGTTLFGVVGKTEVVDTSSGNATTNDLAIGKKAWVDGVEITGTGSPASAFPCPVPKSGAGDMDSYTEAVGEDGHADMRRGTAWPNPRFTVGTGVSSNCVTDNLTGLMWVRNPSQATGVWSAQVSAINDLDGADGRGGYTDWRLANAKELMSLFDCGQHSPPLPVGMFIDATGHYWSSTTAAGNANYAWSFGFTDSGYLTIHYKNNYALRGWAVRGGQ